MKWGDVLIIIVSLMSIISLWSLLHDDAFHASHLRITDAQGHSEIYPLNQRSTVTVDGPAGITVVEIDTGKARCASSPGLQKRCENAGWLSQAGDTAISLPNRVIIEAIGQDTPYDSLHF